MCIPFSLNHWVAQERCVGDWRKAQIRTWEHRDFATRWQVVRRRNPSKQSNNTKEWYRDTNPEDTLMFGRYQIFRSHKKTTQKTSRFGMKKCQISGDYPEICGSKNWVSLPWGELESFKRILLGGPYINMIFSLNFTGGFRDVFFWGSA